VHEFAALRHELAFRLPIMRSFIVRKNFLDVIEVVWWVESLQRLGDDLHALGWSVLLRPSESSVELRVWEHRDSNSDADSDENSNEDSDVDPAAP
jgi:hypothetical protein